MNEDRLVWSDVPPELRDLTDQMSSGTISAAGRDRLDELLREDADNLYFYLIYMDMCAHLQWEFRVGLPAAGQPATVGHSDVEFPVGRCDMAGGNRPADAWETATPRCRPRKGMVWRVAAMVLLALISLTANDRPRRNPDAPPSRDIASVTRLSAARWADPGLALRAGDGVGAGVLDLVQGIAEIEFAGGAVMLLEAPVRVVLVDPRRAVLRFGHVVVRVPERAIGFVVATDRAEIVDLGTEFGVAVGPADTLVEVFKGEVVAEIKGEGGRGTTRNHLDAGQGVQFDSSVGSRPRKVRCEPGRFVRTFPVDAVSPPSGPLYNRSRIDSVHVVPAPPGVIVDGSLSDWDMSGTFRSECVAPYGEHHYLEGAMMYDDRYVYIGAHVGDPHPMRSIQDPYIDPEYPWRGGSVVVRLAASRSLGWPLRGLSPYFRSAEAPEIGRRPVDVSDSIVHLVLWYFRPGARARLRLSRGMDFHGDLIDPEGWEGAFRRDPDGLGYTLEYAIPWSLLCPASQTPRAGDVTATCWTVHWSDRDGKLSRGHWVDITNPAESRFDHMYSFMHGPSWGKAIFHEASRPARPVGPPRVPTATDSQGTNARALTKIAGRSRLRQENDHGSPPRRGTTQSGNGASYGIATPGIASVALGVGRCDERIRPEHVPIGFVGHDAAHLVGSDRVVRDRLPAWGKSAFAPRAHRSRPPERRDQRRPRRGGNDPFP